jgi:hypothetical protein
MGAVTALACARSPSSKISSTAYSATSTAASPKVAHGMLAERDDRRGGRAGLGGMAERPRRRLVARSVDRSIVRSFA